ncbi:reverse transcriptase domain-containing protein [Tanacetum coccineum]
MLPEDLVDARTLMEMIGNYKMEDGVLYRKSYLVPLMRCVGPFRPIMLLEKYVRELIKACDDCQAHASVPKLTKADMISMEAKPLATKTSKKVVNFTWDIIVCRFGIPATIITDNGTQFGNRAVKRVNRSLLRGIKTRLEKGGLAWAEEVPNVLWAHQTMKKTINGEIPFSLTHDTEAVIPAEIGMPTHQKSKLNEKTNDKELRLNLDLLEERREIEAIREARYKQQAEKYYNKKVRHVQFKVGELVLRKNEALRAANIGKLGPTGEGPYKFIQAFQSGAYKLSNMEGEDIPTTGHACNHRRHMGLPFELEWDPLPNYTIRSLNSLEWRKIIFRIITSMGIRHTKAYTLRRRSSMKLEQRDTPCASLNIVFPFVLTQICNEDLRTELEYFSEDYDEGREMEPRPEPNQEATPTLRPRSPMVCRQREGVVGFEEAPNKEGSRRGRNTKGSFTDSTGSVTPFIHWIKDYPLLDGLKMPSHIGSYDGKGDPENFLHLFEILGLHEEQCISGFVHGLRTRSLVEYLSIDLPTTYKGLMEKTYTWIEVREVATNGTPNDRRENFERSKKSSWDNNREQKDRDRFSPYRGPNHGLLFNLYKSPREILATEKATRSFEQPPRMFGSRRSRDMSKYFHFHEDFGHDTNDYC